MIKKIVIEIGDKEIELSKDEAVKLRDDLTEVLPRYYPPVYVPTVWAEPMYPPSYPSYTITTTGGATLNSES